MENIVIIKLYRQEYDSDDYHDLFAGDEEDASKSIVAKLKRYGKKIGKTVLFTVCPSLDVASFDMFAEIEYNGELTNEEKTYYLDCIKEFSKDAEIYR